MAQNFNNILNKPIEIVQLADSVGNIINPLGTYPAFSAPASPAFDAFGRQRVSTPLTLFDSSHRYSDNALWETQIIGSGATTAFNPNQGLVELKVGTGTTDQVTRETKRVFAYQPGKSLLVLNTFTPANPQANLIQKIGYYGAQNGIYFQISGTIPSFVQRTYVTGSVQETTYPQSSWNVDPLDGTGPSGITIDLTKSQILWMDLEWLGVGTVRLGFIINGKFIHCHSIHHANLITGTYITTASLPLRYEIQNTGTVGSGSTLRQICSTVLTEGGYELRGLQQSVSTGVTTPYTLTNSGTYYPVISMRLKSTRLDAIVIPSALSMMGAGNNANYSWRLVRDCATSGGSWSNVSATSSVEYNLSGTSVSGGSIVASGFFNATTQSVPILDVLKEALFRFQLERNGLAGTPYELCLQVAGSSASQPAYVSLDWEEITR